MTSNFEGGPADPGGARRVGDAAKAVTEVAIGSAVMSPARRAVRVVERDHDRRDRDSQPPRRLVPINVADPKVFIGLLISGSITFISSSLRPMPAVSDGRRHHAGVVAQVRRRRHHGRRQAARLRPSCRHLHGCIAARLGHAAIIALLAPVIIGFGLGSDLRSVHFLASVIVVGRLDGQPSCRRRARLDNAKKYIEDQQRGRQGLDPRGRRHRATPSATRSRTPPRPSA